MKWPVLTKRQVIIGAAVLAVLQIVLIVHFVNWIRTDSSQGKELTELKKQVAEAHAIIQQEASIRHSLAQSIADLGPLTEYAPTRSDRYAWAYEYVSGCASQSQVTLDSQEEVILNPDDKNKTIDRPYEIRVFAHCGYNRLDEFLWRLEKGNPLLRIRQVTISPALNVLEAPRVQIAVQWWTALKIEPGAQ